MIFIAEAAEESSIFDINNSEEFGSSTGRLQLAKYPDDYEGLYTVLLTIFVVTLHDLSYDKI